MEICVEFNFKAFSVFFFFLAPFELVVLSEGAYYLRILIISIYAFGYFPLLRWNNLLLWKQLGKIYTTNSNHAVGIFFFFLLYFVLVVNDLLVNKLETRSCAKLLASTTLRPCIFFVKLCFSLMDMLHCN